MPPITKWKAEREKPAADLTRLDGEYLQLRADTVAVEKIKRGIDDILDDGIRKPQRKRTHDFDR